MADTPELELELERLSSMQNPTVQRLRTLKTAKGREAEGWMLVEGEKMILEALSCGLLPLEALVEDSAADRLGALIGRLQGALARVYAVPRRILEAVCDTVTPSGCCAAFAPPTPLDLSDPPDLLVALDALQDPGNVGTIWRTADAAGFGGLVLGASCDPASPKVVRGSMGSCFRLPAAPVSDLGAALAALKSQGYQLVTTELEGGDIYRRPALGSKLVVVIGSEARGVSKAVSALADVKLRLPMRGGAESLNAAVAAGIILYELTRGL